MKKRIIFTSLIAIITITVVVGFTRNAVVSKEPFFSEEEIAHTSIESIEVIDYKTNNQLVIDEKNFIKQIASTLKNVTSDKTATSSDINENPLYVLYLRNVGYYPGGGIGIYKHHIEYKGETPTMTSEESLTLLKLLDDKFQGENQ